MMMLVRVVGESQTSWCDGISLRLLFGVVWSVEAPRGSGQYVWSEIVRSQASQKKFWVLLIDLP